MPLLPKSIYLLALVFTCAQAKSANIPPSVGNETDWCKVLSGDLMSVDLQKCSSYSWNFEGTASMKGSVIPFLKWGNEKGKKIMILGSMHGDEISSVSLAFRWIDLMQSSNSDSELRKYNYWIVPLVNPDGYFTRPRTRTNASGVDLNRNFRSKRWELDALSEWKKKAHSDPRSFPGKTSGSEKETILMEKWIEEFNPDLIISIHAPYNLIDHDGPVLLPKAKSPLKIKTLGAFPGSLGQFAGVEKSIPVITVELAEAKKMPDANMIDMLLEFVVKSKKKE